MREEFLLRIYSGLYIVFLSPRNIFLDISSASPPESSRGQSGREDEMKKELKEITIGKAVKYKRVKFDVAKIVALYKSGKPVSAIALAIGFPPNCGQNRTRRVLEQAGIYKRTAAKKKKKAAKAA
jgi:hypothetical protein